MSIVTDKETIFIDELIRENARLTVQHEADLLRADQLEEALADAKAAVPAVQEAEAKAAKCQMDAHVFKVKLEKSEAMLRKALADLHFVMAGGDPCKVCTVKCAFGVGSCMPVWHGETEEADE